MSTDWRQIFFDKLRIVGESRNYNEENAIALFLSLFELHEDRSKDVITDHNVTEYEKHIIYRQLINFMHNIRLCFHGRKNASRELLSGMVVFRLEVLPILFNFVKNQDKRNIASLYLPYFARKEHRVLKYINVLPRTDVRHMQESKHALHRDPWWLENCEVESEAEIFSNYQFTD